MPLKAIIDDTPVVASLCDDDEWEATRSLAKSRPSALVLPGCEQECYPRVSRQGLRHFAHRPGMNCGQHPGESAVHLAAKAAIVQAAAAAGWHAETEVIGEGWIADTLVTRGTVRVAFEVQWSPQTLKRYVERQTAYNRSGVRTLWFVQKLPNTTKHEPGSAPAADLPMFVMDANRKVDDGADGVTLTDAVQQLLAGRVQFRTKVARRDGLARETVKVWQVPCWNCKKLTAVWDTHSMPVVGACGFAVQQDSDRGMWVQDARPEAHPAVAALARELAVGAGGTPATIGFKKTAPVLEGYLAFNCGHCSYVQGDFHLRQTLLGMAYDAPLAEGIADLGSVAVATNSPHWCWDRGSGHCPPGEADT